MNDNNINNQNEIIDNKSQDEKMNDSLEKNEDENKAKENNENKNNHDEAISKDKLAIFEKAMTDENYSNSNYLIECFHSIDGPFYKIQNDMKNLDEEDEEEIIKQMHINDNLEQIKEEENENKNEDNNKGEIPEELADIKVKDNNIENMKDVQKAKFAIQQKNNLLNSFKNKMTISSEISATELGKPPFKHLYDNLQDFSMENNLYKGILYDLVDFFDNKKYNMDRLKPIDFSDLKALLKNFNKNNVFKQLSKDEKKDYITN